MTKKIAVIGLGKLGACHAAVMAYKGFEVVGADINQNFVDAINNGKAPVIENQLQDLIDKSGGRLKATTNVVEAVRNSEVIFVIVPTPSDEEGRFSMEYALKAAEKIGEGLKESKGYPIVVMTSTVMPGDTGGKFVPVLEKASGKKMLKDFGVCYSPEFIALGSVVRDMLYPDMILIGQSDKKAGDIIQSIYEGSTENKPYFARMNFVNAELTKISVNTYVTTKISYANMLAQVCSKIPGADVDVVSNAVGQDSRIGIKYIKGGLAFGGPCFPRDNIAFGKVAEDVGIDPIMAKATDNMNHAHTKYIADLIETHLHGKKRVGVLGLSYKPNTPVIDVSPGIALVREITKKGLEVFAYDPLAMENAKKVISNINYCNSMAECLRGTDAIVICTSWPEFNSISPDDVGKDVAVIDCWRILDQEKWKNNSNLIRLGTKSS
jgi:UDPglucose 6-dehydrogenase